MVCGAVLAIARVPAWETGGVGTSRFASVRRPGWVSDAPRVASVTLQKTGVAGAGAAVTGLCAIFCRCYMSFQC